MYGSCLLNNYASQLHPQDRDGHVVWGVAGRGVRFLAIVLGTEQVTQEIVFDCLIAVVDF